QYVNGLGTCYSVEAVVMAALFTDPLAGSRHSDKIRHCSAGHERSEIRFIAIEKLLEIMNCLSFDLGRNRIRATKRILMQGANDPVAYDRRRRAATNDLSEVSRPSRIGDSFGVLFFKKIKHRLGPCSFLGKILHRQFIY